MRKATEVALKVTGLIPSLLWDFKTSFPLPTDEAIDNGVMDESDREPENLKSFHETCPRECLATLATIDKVSEARRTGIDPRTGKKPGTHAARERLRKELAEKPAKLEHSFNVLIDTYGEGFGQDAADAFRKAIRAWHAGIPVQSESEPSERPPAARPSSSLPVPTPLRSSVNAGIFGHDENGKPIRPSADEVRAITEEQAERMMEMNDAELQSAVAKYAEDFGSKAASQLERYVRRQQRSR